MVLNCLQEKAETGTKLPELVIHRPIMRMRGFKLFLEEFEDLVEEIYESYEAACYETLFSEGVFRRTDVVF